MYVSLDTLFCRFKAGIGSRKLLSIEDGAVLMPKMKEKTEKATPKTVKSSEVVMEQLA